MARDFYTGGNRVIITKDTSINDTFDSGCTLLIHTLVESMGDSSRGKICNKNSNGWEFGMKDPPSFGQERWWFKMHHSTTTGIWDTDTDFSLNEYHSVGLYYDSDSTSNDPEIFEDGSKFTVGSGITEISAPAGTRSSDSSHDLRLGDNNFGNFDFDGHMALFVLYPGVQLTDNEQTAFSNGVNPFTIRHESQAIYLPLHGNDSTEPDFSGTGNTGAVTGTAKVKNPAVEHLENYI